MISKKLIFNKYDIICQILCIIYNKQMESVNMNTPTKATIKLITDVFDAHYEPCRKYHCESIHDIICKDEKLLNNQDILNYFMSRAHKHSKTCIKTYSFGTIVDKYISSNDITITHVNNANTQLVILYMLIMMHHDKPISSRIFARSINPHLYFDHVENTKKIGECIDLNSIYDIMGYNKLEKSEHYLFCYNFWNVIKKSSTNNELKNIPNHVTLFFKNIISLYFKSLKGKSKMNILCNMLNSSEDKESSIYELMKFMLANEYINPNDIDMDILQRRLHHDFLELFLDYKVPFEKKHLRILICSRVKNIRENAKKNAKSSNKINLQPVPKNICDLITKYNIDIDYDDVIHCCENSIIFPEEFVKGMKFDNEYYDLCIKHGVSYYDTNITGQVPYNAQILEDKCLTGVSIDELKNIIKKNNVKPTQVCMKNACLLKNNTAVIKYLLSCGLTIDTDCLANMMKHMKQTGDRFVIAKYLELNGKTKIETEAKQQTKKQTVKRQVKQKHNSESEDDDSEDDDDESEDEVESEDDVDSDDNDNNNNNVKNIVNLDDVPECNAKDKKKSSLFGEICSSLKSGGYVTASSFKKHLMSYILNNHLSNIEGNIKVDKLLSELSKLKQNDHVKKSDVNKLADLIFTKN